MGKIILVSRLVLCFVIYLFVYTPRVSAGAAVAQIPFFEGFESGVLEAHWTSDGTANYLTQITSDYGPATGDKHLVMACTEDRTYSRNELTLTADLANYENVILTYDAVEYGDEAHGPPAYPFVDHADFDGVAVSADGTHWFEVASLRSLSSAYRSQTVDLDAVVSAAGISYNSTFKIRFNQYDNFALTTDGIGIDNVSITGDLLDDLRVTPRAPQTFFGYEAGPFSPGNLVFNLTNLSSNALSWTVSSTPWLICSSAGDVLAAGSNDAVIVSLNPATLSRVPGTYDASITFRNEESGFEQRIPVSQIVEERVMDHFEWAQIGSNQVAGIPFPVVVTAKDGGGQTFSGFTDIVSLRTVSGEQLVTISPSNTESFVNGVWTGAVTVFEAATNIMLCADDGALHIGNSNPLNVHPLMLSVLLPEAVNEGEAAVSAQVEANFPSDFDLEVFLNADFTNELVFPPSVILPAGQTHASFDILAFDDQLLDGTVHVTLTALSTNLYQPGSGSLSVHDNETATLTLSLPETAYEGAGLLKGAVQVDRPPVHDFLVELRSGDTNELISSSVVIPAGQTIVPMELAIVDDEIMDGVKTVVVEAHVENWTGDTCHVFVFDNERAAVSPEVPGEMEEGAMPWPMYQGNKEHTGYVPVFLAPDASEELWSKTVGSGRALNPVTVAEGKVYASVRIYHAAEDHLFVLDALTGEQKWVKNFGSVARVNPPSYAYGNVYIQTGNHTPGTYLHAYNAETGTLVFKSPHSAQWEEYFAPTIEDGVVYINGGYYGGMYAFDAYSGAQNWFAGLAQYDEWTPTIGPDYAYCYVGGLLSALNKDTGETEFTIRDPNFDWHGWSMNTVAVYGETGRVYAVHDGRLITFDTPARLLHENSASFKGQPSYHDGVVYALNGSGVSAVSTASNLIEWSWGPLGDTLTQNIIVTDSHLIVGSASKTYMVDLNTHQMVWSYPKGGHLSLAESVLYIASSNGELTAISVLPRLEIELVDDATEGDGIVRAAGILRMGEVLPHDLLVNLYLSDLQQVNALGPVTIPAGQTNVVFDLEIVDDNLMDGSQLVTIGAVSEGYASATDTFWVHDNESATLSLTLPETVVEGTGDISGMVNVNPVADRDVVVRLLSDNPEKIAVGYAVIKAGDSGAAFTLSVLDNELIDGVQTATIEAYVENWESASASIFIADNESTELQLRLPSLVMEGDGIITNAGEVMLSGTLLTDANILLKTLDASEVTVPFYVTIPAGQTNAFFDITAVDDDVVDGKQFPVIAAEAPGLIPCSESMRVSDNEFHHFTLVGFNGDDPGYLPVPCSVHAVNIDEEYVDTYSGPVWLSGMLGTDSVPVDPSEAITLTNGVWQGDVTFHGVGDDAVIFMDDRQGHVGTSQVTLGRFNIVKMATDWELPYIYMVHRYETSPNRSILIWYNTDTQSIEHAVSAGENATDLTVHYGDNKIYVSNYGRPETRVIDRALRTEVDPLYLNDKVYRINAGRMGRIHTAERDWFAYNYLYDTTNQTQLVKTSPIYPGDGECTLDGRYLYYCEAYSSGDSLMKVDLSLDTFNIEKEIAVAGSGNVLLSIDGQRIMTNRRVYDAELNVLVSIGADMYAASAYGDLVITRTKAYNGVTGAEVYALPFPSTVMAFSGDQTSLVLFNETEGSLTNLSTSEIMPVPAVDVVPDPEDGSVQGANLPELNWTGAPAAIGYDVYLGTASNTVAAASTNSAEYLGRVTDPTMPLPIGALSGGKTYFWRVDTVGFRNQMVTGNVWNFVTPAIYLEPSELVIDSVVAAYTQNVSVVISAVDGTPSWTVSTTNDWIMLGSASGTAPATLDIEFDISKLAAGEHQGAIKFTSGGVGLTLPVKIALENMRIVKMETDWARPYIYMAHTSSAAPNKSRLIWYNTDTETIEHVVGAGENITDLTVHYGDDRLYVSNWKHPETRVFDLSTRLQLEPLALGGDVYKINAAGPGQVITEEEDQWITVRMRDTVSGTQVASRGEREGDGDSSLDGLYYFHTDNNSSGARLSRFDISNNGFANEISVKTKYYYGSRNVFVSGDGQRVFNCGTSYRAADLREITNFGTEAYAASFYGKYAVTATDLRKVDSNEVVLGLPVSGAISAFSRDQEKLVLYDAANGTIVALDLTSVPGLDSAGLQVPGLAPGLADGANVAFSQNWMEWAREPFAVGYEVYFGTDSNAVATATTNSVEFLGMVEGDMINLPASGLVPGTTYYWRVDAIGVGGLLSSGVWSFTAASFGFEPSGVDMVLFNIDGLTNSTLTIDNRGGSEAWTITSMPAWMSASMLSGNGDGSVVLSVDKSMLPAGKNEGTLTVSTGGHLYDLPVEVLRLNEAVKCFEPAANGKLYAASYESGHDQSYLLEISGDPLVAQRVIELPENITDMDIDPSGTNLYAISFKDGSLARIELSSFEVTDMKNVPGTAKGTSAQHFHVEAGRDGIIYYLDGAWAPVAHVFDYDTGLDLSTQSNGGQGLGGLLYDDAKQRIYSWRQYGWSAGNLKSWVYAFNTVSNKLVKADTSAEVRRDPLGAPLMLVDSGKSLIHKKLRYNADNLSIIEASFFQDIYAATSDGALAVGSAQVYRGTDGTLLTTLPYSTGMKTLLSDDQRIVHYNSTTKTIETTRLVDLFDPLMQASNRVPVNGATVMSSFDTFSWAVQDGASRFEVYFGTDSNAVVTAKVGDAVHLGSVHVPFMQLPTNALTAHQTYYWRVDAVGYDAAVATGPVQEFRVAALSVDPVQLDLQALDVDYTFDVPVELGTFNNVAVEWTAVENESWLALDQTTGTGSVTVVVSIDAGQLDEGTVNSSITFTDSAGYDIHVPLNIDVFSLNITKMEADAFKPKVYALNVVQEGTKPSQLVVLDASSEEVETVVSVVDNASDFAVHSGDDRIYVSAFGNAAVSVIDRTDYRRLEDLTLHTQVYRISSGIAGRLVTEDDGSGNAYYGRMRVWDSQTGTLLQTTASYTTGRGTGESIADGLTYYRGDSTSYPYSGMLRKYDLSGGTLAGVKSIAATKSSRRELVLSGDGSRVFWTGGRVYDADLNEITNLGAEVYAASSDGSMAATTSAIYDVDGGTAVATLPVASTVMAFAVHDTRLVYFDAVSGWVEWVVLSPAVANDVVSPMLTGGRYAEMSGSGEFSDWTGSYFPLLTVAPDAMADSDLDGQLNIEEYVAGTDPTRNDSCFAVHGFQTLDNGDVVITWEAVSNRVYSVEFTSSLNEPFQILEDQLFYPVNSFTDRVDRAETGRFYRIGVKKQD